MATDDVAIQMTSPSPSPKHAKPPKYPATSPDLQPQPQPQPQQPLLTKRNTFKPKPKSRFGEPSLPIDSQTLENITNSSPPLGFEPETPRTFSFSTPKAQDKDKKKEKERPDEKEIYERVTAQLRSKKTKNITCKLVVELVIFSVILVCLLCSLTVEKLENTVLVGLVLWKWFVLLMVIFSGKLITGWFVQLLVFVIEWKFMLQKNLVYFTHGLKTSVEVFVWICVILVTWVCLFRPDVKETKRNKKILSIITWSIASLLIGSFLWLIKTTLIKMLAASFHLNRFFERIQESVFHHYVLQTLAGRPVVELARRISRDESRNQVSFTEHMGSQKETKVVDWAKLHQMKQEKVPSWTMQLLVDVVQNSGLSTVSGFLSENVVQGGVELDDDEISSEEEAIATAVRIFNNVVHDKDDPSYIDQSDLLRFMIREEVELVYPWFEVNENKQITLRAFSRWVVKVFNDRQALQHALNDNKTAVKQLNKLLSGILIVIMFIIWLLVTEIASTKLLLFFSSQLVVAAFIFGNTCKTIFEAIIFVFVMHPFDVGDRCIIDGAMLVVEEMNILTTVFLKVDKEKLYYPNAVLSTKPIGNYYRSPEQGDSLEFAIDYRTPLSIIAELKDRIRKYLEENHNLWQPDHNLVVREIENINRIKMALFFNHTMNFQDFAEKTKRRSQLVLDMKKIFDDLNIGYNLLPQEVVLRNMPTNY